MKIDFPVASTPQGEHSYDFPGPTRRVSPVFWLSILDERILEI